MYLNDVGETVEVVEVDTEGKLHLDRVIHFIWRLKSSYNIRLIVRAHMRLHDDITEKRNGTRVHPTDVRVESELFCSTRNVAVS